MTGSNGEEDILSPYQIYVIFFFIFDYIPIQLPGQKMFVKVTCHHCMPSPLVVRASRVTYLNKFVLAFT